MVGDTPQGQTEFATLGNEPNPCAQRSPRPDGLGHQPASISMSPPKNLPRTSTVPRPSASSLGLAGAEKPRRRKDPKERLKVREALAHNFLRPIESSLVRNRRFRCFCGTLGVCCGCFVFVLCVSQCFSGFLCVSLLGFLGFGCGLL